VRRDTLAGVVSMAVSDALGKYGEQPDLRSEHRHLRDKGDRLQVAGLIDMAKLGQRVAAQVIDVVKREHPEIVEEESWDDL
jgi:hypothetical protein